MQEVFRHFDIIGSVGDIMVKRDTGEYLRNFNLTILDKKLAIACFLELITITFGSGGRYTSESRKENTVCVG